MLVLVVGQSGSGKSALAEQMAVALGRNRVYLATMQPFGKTATARIARHRTQRQGKGFTTQEQYGTLTADKIEKNQVVLLECVSNLLANCLFSLHMPPAKAYHSILRQLVGLQNACAHLVAVCPLVGADGEDYPPEMQVFIALLGRILRRLAHRADQVVESVCGIGVQIKGEMQ